MWRHGDVLVAAVNSIPAAARKRPNGVLAHGELTGHSHRIERLSDAEVLEHKGQLYLRVLASARIVHDEHKPITLPQGIYRVWQQREYTPDAIRIVED